MDHHVTPRTRKGVDAAQAALDELEIRERIDEPDPSAARPGDYDLAGADERVGRQPRVAAASDIYTPDEALDDLATALGREVPATGDDDYDHD